MQSYILSSRPCDIFCTEINDYIVVSCIKIYLYIIFSFLEYLFTKIHAFSGSYHELGAIRKSHDQRYLISTIKSWFVFVHYNFFLNLFSRKSTSNKLKHFQAFIIHLSNFKYPKNGKSTSIINKNSKINFDLEI